MKRLGLIIICVILAACNSRSTQNNQSITVTILPIKHIVEQITGTDFNVQTLVPPGASPETYEPTPQQIIKLAQSKYIFSIGLIDFEKQLTSKIEESDFKVIELCAGIKLIKGTCGHTHHNQGVDPHIWTSPRLLKTMAKTVYSNIIDNYPDSIKYTDNYNKYISRLDSLDNQISKMITDSGIKNFIIYHPALTYYAQDYNIEQITLEHEGKEPTAERLKNIIFDAKSNNTKTILYQNQFSRTTVETVAKDIGAECVEIDPLSENVVTNLIEMTKIITKR